MWVRGHSRTLKTVPLESVGTVFYSHSIVTMVVSLAVLTQYTNVTDLHPASQTDEQTDTTRLQRPRLWHRAAIWPKLQFLDYCVAVRWTLYFRCYRFQELSKFHGICRINFLILTLKQQNNGPLHRNYYYTAIRWLVHWPLMGGLLHLVQRGGAWVGWGSAQAPPRCTKCNSPSINDQCTNFILFDVAL